MNTIRIAAPKQARKGEVIELKAMIAHDMESGFRRDQFGRKVPRDILKHFECVYNGETVFAAEFFPAVAANPLLVFYITATDSGTLEFRWVDQQGKAVSDSVELLVQ